MSGARARCLGFRVQGLGFRVQGWDNGKENGNYYSILGFYWVILG